MVDRLVRWLHRVVGHRLRLLVLAGETWTSLVVALGSVAVVSTYYDPPVRDVLLVMAVAGAFTAATISFASWRVAPGFRLVRQWRESRLRTPQDTVRAWEVATSLTLGQFRRTSALVGLASSVPATVVAAQVWDLGWGGLGALLLASVVPVGYATVLSYSVGEALMRPVVQEIAAELPASFEFRARGIPLVTRLYLSLPVYTTISGAIAVGLLGGGDGTRALVVAVGVSLAVGLFFSLELASLFGVSIVGPLADVRDRLAEVRDGDLDTRALVTTSDELGELAHDFNLMAAGLAEREAIRDTFGTYLDRDVARLILAGEVAGGEEVEVSVLFCDVRGFTAYAERAGAAEVVETLNQLFTDVVPVVQAYGGHVDKFLGDGLMAFFGAPEAQPDHADRALAAARMIVDVVALGGTGLRVGAGVNSGVVVAGPLGGAGRLDFSVIGDAVNVAARVEAATRRTGDDVLVTAATRDLLTWPQALVSRGTIPLPGREEPLELFAPSQTPEG